MILQIDECALRAAVERAVERGITVVPDDDAKTEEAKVVSLIIANAFFVAIWSELVVIVASRGDGTSN